eukprot:CAMPEP_0179035468 /NCGR_PEP_ID=MMETSP0796-20121207/13127_1 /TAXON_ID=73915 /ORGANISM="Pyrodinium bahamense, Strain pbaha01" /LENGTH=81 /DNA_ID=CAMNT_0020731743 /DNA_START=205 /DNA_END=448 /DNA_ORIENTATION=+
MAMLRRWRILVTKRRYLGMMSQMPPSSSSLCVSPSDDSSSSSSVGANDCKRFSISRSASWFALRMRASASSSPPRVDQLQA